MGGFETTAPNSFGWAEINTRGVDKAIAFYTQVFGWTVRTSPMGEGQPDYHEFQVDGHSIAGAVDIPADAPSEMQGGWQVYFSVPDVKAAHTEGNRARGPDGVRAAGLPGRRVRHRDRPAGRLDRPAEDGPVANTVRHTDVPGRLATPRHC